jgi:hypothetical protein
MLLTIFCCRCAVAYNNNLVVAASITIISVGSLFVAAHIIH